MLPTANNRVPLPKSKAQVSRKQAIQILSKPEGDGMATASRCNSMAASITETEAACLLGAPDAALEEEKRLEEERHRNEQLHAASHSNVDPRAGAALDAGRFSALETLLNKSELYSAFLSEQILHEQNKPVLALPPQASKAAPPAAKKKATRGKRDRNGEAKTEEVATQELTPTQKLLPMMQVELRDYQLKGVRWLMSLYSNGLNGILADQMGLGKTIQTIGFLSHLKSKGVNGPFMVIGPLSTLPNWINEFARFCPTMPALMYHGSRQEREELRATRLRMSSNSTAPPDFPVIVTSFEIVIADAKFLQKIKMKYVVVDEGHRLKNFNCKLMQELKTIPAENRLLLSGTPLQNNLDELWSLLNYIMPSVFSNLEDFKDWFNFSNVGQDGADKEILAAEQRNKAVSKLHAILKPFVLRRLKSDVDIALPQKAEVLLYAHMTENQKELNQQLLDGTLKEGMRQLADRQGGRAEGAGSLNNVLMQMRKVANHPDLITGAFSGDNQFPEADELVRQCGKMQLLERLLGKLQRAGHKVLIFSQMTKMLDLLHSYFEQKGHRACRIDGSIPWQERQRNIQDFNSDPSTWLFLLSTRAGGLGINLTAADTVIIYDSDWNPHQDLQAMDRCHRIGQTRPVLVLRLATAHSVEGKMLRRADSKMALERLVIKKGAFLNEGASSSSGATSMSAAELMEVLRSNVSLQDVPQSGVVSEDMLDRILDRSYLVADTPCPYDASGVGYEVIQRAHGNASLLKNIEEEASQAMQEEEASQDVGEACPSQSVGVGEV